LGFLLTLAALGGGVYYGIEPARGYVKYYRMKEAMQAQAHFAANATDADIRRQLQARAKALGLPPDAQRFTIRRRGRPREVIVSTSWTDTLALPFYAVPFTYRPEVRAPL
jgi:hypothetical protein